MLPQRARGCVDFVEDHSVSVELKFPGDNGEQLVVHVLRKPFESASGLIDGCLDFPGTEQANNLISLDLSGIPASVWMMIVRFIAGVAGRTQEL